MASGSASGTEIGSDRGSALYDLGSTTIFACRSDPRFSYCLYVPPDFATAATRPELVVTVHGTGRSCIEYRNAFAEFGQWNNCVILSPLFPVGVLGDGNRDGFKYIREGDIRYDLVLLDMVAEVEAKYGLAFPRFAMFGFSGGGHFANRFLLLHPERLWAASIGAPGSVTLLDEDRDWWVGVRNLKDLFGRPVDREALRRVAVHMVVGGADRETWEITHREGGRHWMPGANDAGATRPDRLQALQRSFEAAGMQVSFELVPGVSHDGLRCSSRSRAFFAAALARLRAPAAA